jgi:hypothetical protein
MYFAILYFCKTKERRNNKQILGTYKLQEEKQNPNFLVEQQYLQMTFHMEDSQTI